MVIKDGSGRSQHPKQLTRQHQKQPDDKRREQFARAIARSEFGRFYWDDRRETELKAARKRRKKPKP